MIQLFTHLSDALSESLCGGGLDFETTYEVSKEEHGPKRCLTIITTATTPNDQANPVPGQTTEQSMWFDNNGALKKYLRENNIVC